MSETDQQTPSRNRNTVSNHHHPTTIPLQTIASGHNDGPIADETLLALQQDNLPGRCTDSEQLNRARRPRQTSSEIGKPRKSGEEEKAEAISTAIQQITSVPSEQVKMVVRKEQRIV